MIILVNVGMAILDMEVIALSGNRFLLMISLSVIFFLVCHFYKKKKEVKKKKNENKGSI